MNKFEELEAFVSVVDQLSFSAASDRSGVAKSVLSRRVRDLEKRLGVQLMQRTTRKLALTDTGELFYQRAQNLLADLSDAEQMVSDAQCGLSGRIKLAAPLALGITRLSAPIAEFMTEHSELELAIDLNDREVDLVEDGFDIAIRVGNLQDSNLIARKLADIKFAVCASSAYLEKHGEPKQPHDLNGREVMIYSNTTPGRQWSLVQNGERITPRVKYRITANNGELLAKLASHGLGLTAGPLFFLQAYIDRGELIPVLSDCTIPTVGMYAVYPPGRLVSRRVKMLSDFLYEYFRERII